MTWTPPNPASVGAPALRVPEDIHTHSKVAEYKPLHLHLDWSIDWNARTISGRVSHVIELIQPGITSIILDASYLKIDSVHVEGKQVDYTLGTQRGTLGAPLHIPIPSSINKKGDKVHVDIDYSTTEHCTALGWLTTEQTAGQTNPFLYSQCQAIHCRSLVPCIDSPSHKITYTATVHSRIPVLMSALKDDSKPSKAATYHFKQPVGIPSYLIAIVGGDLEFRKLGERTGIWAEPPNADAVQWEFEADAERFLEHAEKVISPYSWTRYDSVVLPPSFPYGGMENANLTTLTPSLVCGDRSLTDVLLHELCHSWSGNLTSCANWTHFWLNEGWTVYLERLLLQEVHGPKEGPAHRGFSYIIGSKALKDALAQFTDTPRFQRLIPAFKDGEDPDDAFSSIPYEKGSNFLLYLERTVGGLGNFLPYAKSYFHAFYNRSVTTQEWREHLFKFFESNAEATAALHKVDWDAWLYGEGLELPVKMEYDTSLAEQAFSLASRWIQVIDGHATLENAKFRPADIKGWNANQVVVFLERLHSGPKVPLAITHKLDEVYEFSKASNGEVLLRFFEVALEVKGGKYAQQAAEWVKGQGRMKFCRTVYRALNKVEPELAKKTFLDNKSFYHPIAAAQIEKVSRPVGHLALHALWIGFRRLTGVDAISSSSMQRYLLGCNAPRFGRLLRIVMLTRLDNAVRFVDRSLGLCICFLASLLCRILVFEMRGLSGSVFLLKYDSFFLRLFLSAFFCCLIVFGVSRLLVSVGGLQDLGLVALQVQPRTPDVITIFGSTGTGKTKLSVELSLAIGSDGSGFGNREGAEVISCDSMQIYRGLDIITNKATRDEMQGVVHHLIGFLDPEQQPLAGYDVTKFVDDANRLVGELHEKHKVAVVCGGTTYYLQHLMFPGQLISSNLNTHSEVDLTSQVLYQTLDEQERTLLDHVSTTNSAKLDLAAKASGDVSLAMKLWQLLEKIDPVMAGRWHYRDSRKIANSLRVYKETGRAHSQWIAEQDSPVKNVEQTRVSASRKLLFWLWCDPPVLRQRLDDRVDDMVTRGLEAEVREMRAIAHRMLSDVLEQRNYQSGIFQTIGYRQFVEYLDRLDTLGSETSKDQPKWFDKAVQDTKTSTRQYAKSQLKWVQNKLVPEVRRAQAAGSQVELYLLDATDVCSWNQNVLAPALDITRRFLNHQPLPHPQTVSNPTAAKSYLYSGRSANQALSKFAPSTPLTNHAHAHLTVQANQLYTCHVCTFDPSRPVRIREVDRQSHTTSRHHRNNVKRKSSLHTKQAAIQAAIQAGQNISAERRRRKHDHSHQPTRNDPPDM